MRAHDVISLPPTQQGPSMLNAKRLLAVCLLGLIAIASLNGCVTGGGAAQVALSSEDVMVPSSDAGISLFMRNKVPGAMRAFSAERTVLFVHGATYPSEISFDLKLGH